MTDGDWLIGYDCATTCYPTQMAAAEKLEIPFENVTVRIGDSDLPSCRHAALRPPTKDVGFKTSTT